MVPLCDSFWLPFLLPLWTSCVCGCCYNLVMQSAAAGVLVISTPSSLCVYAANVSQAVFSIRCTHCLLYSWLSPPLHVPHCLVHGKDSKRYVCVPHSCWLMLSPYIAFLGYALHLLVDTASLCGLLLLRVTPHQNLMCRGSSGS